MVSLTNRKLIKIPLIAGVFLIGLYPKPVLELVEDGTATIFVSEELEPGEDLVGVP